MDEKGIPIPNRAAQALRDELVKHLKETLRVPENPLDTLINHFGRANVAELTGRTKYYDAGSKKFLPRGGGLAKKAVNLAEMAAFQNGTKKVAVLSGAAGTGISLQAGNRVANQRTRVHITLQPGWSADKAMQMLGRTHRTNQKQPPQYATIASDLAGEKRFTATIAKRMAVMGALTRGSTEASGAEGMDKADYFGKQGIQAATSFGVAMLHNRPLPGEPTGIPGRTILSEMGMLKTNPQTGGVSVDGLGNVARFLNRVLALDPDLQNKVFDYFQSLFESAVQDAIENGTLDTGVRELPGDKFQIAEQRSIAEDPENKAKTYYYRVNAETNYVTVSPSDLEKAVQKHPNGEFYINKQDNKIIFGIPANPITHNDGSTTEAIRYIAPHQKAWVRMDAPGPRSHFQEVGKLHTDTLAKAKEKLAEAERKVTTDRSMRLYAEQDRRQQAVRALSAGKPMPTAREQAGRGDYLQRERNTTNKGKAPAAIQELQSARTAVADAEADAAVNPTEFAKRQWASQHASYPKSYFTEHHMIGGAVMSHWNTLKPFVRGNSFDGGIRLARDSKTGERIVGVVIPQSEAPAVVGQIGGGTVQVTPDQIVNDVLMNGTEYQLKDVRVKRTNIARNPVVQLIPANKEVGRVLIDRFFVHFEKGLTPVYYIPDVTDVAGVKTSARSLLGKIMQDFPLAAQRLAGDQSGSISVNAATFGLAKFWQKDVGPGLAKAAKGIVEAKDDIAKWLAPASRGAGAHATQGVLRYTAAETERSMDRARAALEEADAELRKLPAAVRWDFVNRIETGVPQADIRLQAIANTMRTMLDSARDEVQQLGKGKLQSFYANYFPHIWKNPKQAAGVFAGILGRRPFEGRKSFLKQRTIVTIADGMAAGLEPVSDNPVELVLAKLGEMQKYIMAQRALEVEKAEGRAKFGRGLSKPKNVAGDWRMIDDPIATVYGPRNADGSATIRGRYWAPEASALLFNNYLSPGWRAKSAAFRGYMAVGNMLLQFQLGWSAFHGTFVSLAGSMTGRAALGIYQASHGAKLEGLKTFATGLTPITPFQDYREGKKIQAAWDRPATAPASYQQMADAVAEAGGRAHFERVYQTHMVDRMVDAFRQGNLLGGLIRSPFAATEQVARPIMQYLVPRMKMGAYARMAKFELERAGPNAAPADVRAALGRAWDSIDNRFGQLVYDNLGWNRALKDGMQASFRTVGWNTGDIREVGGGAVDAGKGLVDALRGKRFEVTPRLSYLIAMGIVAGLYGAITNYLMTGEWPEDAKTYFFPHDGEGGRFSLPTYMKEGFSVVHSPLDWLKGKVHPLITLMADELSNRDYFNRPIAKPGDPWYDRAKALATYPWHVAEPISLQGWERNQDASLKKQIAPFVGFPKAPKYIDQDGGGNAGPQGLDDWLAGR